DSPVYQPVERRPTTKRRQPLLGWGSGPRLPWWLWGTSAAAASARAGEPAATNVCRFGWFLLDESDVLQVVQICLGRGVGGGVHLPQQVVMVVLFHHRIILEAGRQGGVD